ncbi:SPOR domain-containing protein [Thermotoga sp.]|uniref:SPOR domain-containing protein n=1 Tax=Thermotoga sp. TaxID=28240 RepID=UPI0025DBC90C|nr:SPOR domain-containing protein [Thermotoga sp.]MCD6550636.1 SPOR domain-containing protein [Thermotoga sp.]
MARVTLSEGQSRFLFWLIVVIFSAVIALLSYNLYLKWQLKNVKVEIVEIKPVEVNIPEELKVPLEVTPPPTPLLVEFEEFDYEKLRNEMADFVPENQTVSSFVVKKDDALRIIRRSNLPYLISPVSTDTYSIVLLGEFSDFSQVAQKSLYGVFVITTVSENLSKELAYDLRVAGYPSYVYAFTKREKNYYSVVVGAFPTRRLAEDYFEKLDWNDIMKRIGVSSPGYAGRLISP